MFIKAGIEAKSLSIYQLIYNPSSVFSSFFSVSLSLSLSLFLSAQIPYFLHVKHEGRKVSYMALKTHPPNHNPSNRLPSASLAAHYHL